MDKYDRQVRLWGTRGQNRLRGSRVLVSSGNSLGSEVLKGLVLAGVGEYVLLDKSTVAPADCATNYLTPPASLGRPRGQQVRERLAQLNPDVKGLWLKHLEQGE